MTLSFRVLFCEDRHQAATNRNPAHVETDLYLLQVYETTTGDDMTIYPRLSTIYLKEIISKCFEY